jgi:tRNA modification GTPase
VQFETESTIVAIASGNSIGNGQQGALRGAVRLSGLKTRQILESLFPNLSQELGATRHAKRFPTSIDLPELGEIPLSVFYWPNHRSYTGEPSAELHLLGAPVLLDQVQTQILESGARLAKPGEFTLRAFLAGRMDLTQCEAVLGLIHAHSQREFQVALTQLAGGLATPLKELRHDLINLLADLEAGLDFVDEDIAFVKQDEIIERLERAEQRVWQLREQIQKRQGQGVEFQIAIVGPANVGKSSLVNALSSSDASIISPIPGTTRDYIRSRVCWDDTTIDLIDTAGIEEVFESGPRAIAQEKTSEVIEKADLVVVCCSVQDQSNLKPISLATRLWGAWTKSDLPHDSSGQWPIPVERSFYLSVHSGEGLDALRRAMTESVKQWQQQSIDVVPMTGARCKSALANAAESLAHARQATLDSAGEEIVASELRLAMEQIAEVAGTVANNDILDALFSRFCIGK